MNDTVESGAEWSDDEVDSVDMRDRGEEARDEFLELSSIVLRAAASVRICSRLSRGLAQSSECPLAADDDRARAKNRRRVPVRGRLPSSSDCSMNSV